MRILLIFLLISFLSAFDIWSAKSGYMPDPSMFLLPLFILLSILYLRKRLNYVLQVRGNLFFFSFHIFLALIYSTVTTADDYLSTILLIILSLVLYVLTLVLFCELRLKEKRLLFLSATLFLALSIVFDLFFNKDEVTRGAGFADNPNGSALRMCILTTGLLCLIPGRKQRIWLTCLLLLTTVLTLSRSGVLTAAIIFVINYYFEPATSKQLLSVKLQRTVSLAAIFIFLLLALNIVIRTIPAFQNRGAEARINQITGNAAIVGEDDEDGRIRMARDYFNLIIENPLGYGTAMSNNRSFYKSASHNVYLKYLLDYGILATVMFGGLFFGMYKSARALNSQSYLLFLFIIFIGGFFTNTLYDNRSFMIVLALFDSLKYTKND